MNILLSSVRGALQTWWGGVALWLAANAGIVVTEGLSGLVVTALTTVVVGLTIAVIRWAESLKGDEWWKRVLRLVVKLLMVGLSRRQPTYADVESVVKREELRE